jgi:hypothetical protein
VETPAGTREDQEPEKAAAGPEPDAAPKSTLSAKPEKADEGWAASPAAPDSKPALCRSHFPDPIDNGVTAVACEHGSWIRTA